MHVAGSSAFGALHKLGHDSQRRIIRCVAYVHHDGMRQQLAGA